MLCEVYDILSSNGMTGTSNQEFNNESKCFPWERMNTLCLHYKYAVGVGVGVGMSREFSKLAQWI